MSHLCDTGLIWVINALLSRLAYFHISYSIHLYFYASAILFLGQLIGDPHNNFGSLYLKYFLGIRSSLFCLLLVHSFVPNCAKIFTASEIETLQVGFLALLLSKIDCSRGSICLWMIPSLFMHDTVLTDVCHEFSKVLSNSCIFFKTKVFPIVSSQVSLNLSLVCLSLSF